MPRPAIGAGSPATSLAAALWWLSCWRMVRVCVQLLLRTTGPVFDGPAWDSASATHETGLWPAASPLDTTCDVIVEDLKRVQTWSCLLRAAPPRCGAPVPPGTPDGCPNDATDPT